jgi:hypothetical protein
MSIRISVRGDARDVTRHLNKLQRKLVPAAVVSSLTGTAREIRKAGLKWGKDRFSVPASALNKRSTVRRASRSNWSASVSLNYRGMNPGRVFKTAKETKSGVRAGSHSFPHAFLVHGRYGHRYVAEREGKRRMPIESQLIALDQLAQRFQRLTTTGGARIFRRLFTASLKRALQRKGFDAASERI